MNRKKIRSSNYFFLRSFAEEAIILFFFQVFWCVSSMNTAATKLSVINRKRCLKAASLPASLFKTIISSHVDVICLYPDRRLRREGTCLMSLGFFHFVVFSPLNKAVA